MEIAVNDLLTYLPLLLRGTGTTLMLGLGGLAISLVLGMLGAWGKLGSSRAGRRLANLYTTGIRSVPDLCWLLLFYFGAQTLLNNLGALTNLWGNYEIPPFMAGTLTIGIVFGAYMTETFRGAFQSIPKGQFEAASAIGMTKSQAFRLITFPQLLGYALPSLGVNWMVLIKTTALVSIIGLQDVVYYGLSAGRATHNPFLFFLALMGIFLMLTSCSNWILRNLEKRYTRGRRMGQS
jgi:histidine transport system permease protein/arginine/ornithine transport system permease protein